MASILEDWNGVSSGGISSGAYGLGGDMNISAGEGMDGSSFPLSQVSLDNTQDDPNAMFSIQRIPIPSARLNAKGKIIEPLTIHTIAEAGNVIVIATTGKILLRWNIKEAPEEIELPFKEDKVHKVFIDPTSNHIIITTVAGDCYYLHSSKSKVVVLKRFSEYHIESVAWNRYEGTATCTGPILLGTRNGVILETSLEGKEKYVKEVFSMQQNMPICALQIEVFPELEGVPRKYFVMAATANPSRYFQFVGGPDFESLFKYYKELDRQNCTELPGDMNYTELRFFCKPNEPRSKTFALLTGFATYYGSLYYGSQSAGENVTIDTRDIHHTIAPLSIALTEFHLVSLDPKKIVFRNLMSQSIVYERESTQELRGLCPDSVTGLIWLFTDKELYVIKTQNEDKEAWKLFLQSAKDGEPRDFEKALSLCKTDAAREEVRRAQGEYYFHEGNYSLAAEFFAQTSLSLEEISLLFMEKGCRSALRSYLLHKLNALPYSKNAQRTLLCTWITEIFLDEICGMTILSEKDEDMKQSLLLEFRTFLTEKGSNLDPQTTYSLLSSHGCVEELLFYARLIEDYDRVLTHHIQREDVASAIYILHDIPVEKAEVLYYKFAPQMLLIAPHETVDAWIDARFLSPCRLIPALVRYEQYRKNEISKGNMNIGDDESIRYLEYQVKENNNTDPAIHNYLLSLYALEKDDTNLMNFLDYFKEEYIYDVKYALRVCIQEGKQQACVYIYTLLHLYEEAVKLALTVDLELAKYCADKAEDDETKKKLWLLIARYLIENRGDIDAAIGLLEESSLLKIDDLLPWFPSFVIIDQFKDRIVDSLQDYNNKIDDLKNEMDVYTSSAETIRQEIQGLKSRYGEIQGNQVCELCSQAILSRVFYLFPCSHAFHADCLLNEIKRHLTASEKVKVDELLNKLRSLNASSQSDSEMRDKIQSEIDSVVAAECPLCGSIMIQSINKPFISKEEEEEAALWSI